MSAESPETNDEGGPEAGGGDLRARYLPVSRRELRRRREAELTAQRTAQEEADDAADHLAQDDDPGPQIFPAPPGTGDVPAAAETPETEPAETEPAEDPEEAEMAGDEEPTSVNLPAVTDEPTTQAPTSQEPATRDSAFQEQAADPRPEETSEDVEQDEEEAPVPASRRARRLLSQTGRLTALTDERLAEIDEITQQAAAVSAEDPNKVDPELLKKQQALAAKAMQENQERRRREQEEAEREQRRRHRRQRPESEVITRKALRAYAEADEDFTDVPTGEIDPVEARGAHGLELDDMVVATSRQASRQSFLFWLVIILAVLLLIALGLVLYFVL